MKQTLLIFGDSWPAGGELTSDEKSFGQILAEKNNLEYKNYSKEGASNNHLLLQLKQAINEKQYKNSTAIFFLTSYTRTINWRDPLKKSLNAAGLNDIDKMYSKYFYTDELGLFNTTQCILSLQKICKTFSIDDYYVPGWLNFDFTFAGIDLEKIFNKGQNNIASEIGMPDFNVEITEEHKNHHLIFPKNWHPNQEAHGLIADKLEQWIFKNKVLL